MSVFFAPSVHKLSKTSACLATIFLGLLTASLFAEANSVDVSGSTNAGAILQGFQSPIKDNPVGGAKESVSPITPDAPNTSKKPKIQRKGLTSETLDPSLTRGIPVSTVTVKGNTLLPEAEVRALAKSFEGGTWTLDQLQDQLADVLTAKYEAKGYITTLAFIPPQTLKNGQLLIQVEEGTISEISYTPKRWFQERAVTPRIQQGVGEAFQVQKLTNDLRRINENPDLEVGAILSPGEKPGQTKVELAPTTDKFPVHVSAFYDNLGRANVGRQRAGLTLSHNNLLGFGDKFYTSVGWARNSFTELMGYELPIGSHGTKIGVSQAHSNYDFNVGSNNVRGHANIVNVYAKQELYRTERFIAEFESGLALKQSSFDAPGFSQAVGRDRLSVLTEAINLQEFDKYGRTFWRNEVGIGLDILGATTNGESVISRRGAGSQFSRYTTALLRSVILPNKSYFILKGFGQATSDALSALEQFQLGGANTVRGYAEGRYLGDSGFVLSAEYRYPLKFIPEGWVVPKTTTRLKDSLELTSFYDFGGVFNNTNTASTNPSSGLSSANAYAMGMGVGLRAKLTRFLAARLDLGFPLIHTAPNQANARLHFGLESQLF